MLIYFPATVNAPDHPLGVTEHDPHPAGQADFWGLTLPFASCSAPLMFYRDLSVDKGRAKHSGASALKMEPLHMGRKISAPVNFLFPSLHSQFWIHPSGLGLSRNYKFTGNGCDNETMRQ